MVMTQNGEFTNNRSSPNYGISPKLLGEVFPFHFVFNHNLEIIQVGKVLARLNQNLIIGSFFAEHFKIERPNIVNDFEKIKKRSRSLFLLKSLSNNMLLKGQMIWVQEQDLIFFFGSPWITELKSLKFFGLTLKDFAIQDPVVDYLFLIQAQNTALSESKNLTEKLTQQQLKLNQTNQKLAAQYAVTKILQETTTFEEATVQVLKTIGEILNFQVGILWNVNAESNLLECTAIWHDSPDKYSQFEAITLNLSPVSGFGLIRNAWKLGNYVWLENINNSFEDPRKDYATEAELKGSIAFPIKKGTDVIQIFEFFSQKKYQSEENLELAIADIMLKLGQFARREEAEMEQKSADNANQAKTKFLANMSHELKTPLNGILGYAQILRQSSNLLVEEKKGIEIIHQCAAHLLTLINDILDLSKIESRKMEIHPVEVHFSYFLKNLVDIFCLKADQKEINFINQFDHTLPIGVETDEKLLRQVLMNLLSNAINFTDHGTVTFSVSSKQTPVVELKKENRSLHYVRFEVKDTGEGINSEDLEKIFLPFEQLGDAQKHSKDTGLGLAISSRIVTLMGGNLQVQSHLGKGSTFSFEIPLLETTAWKQNIQTNNSVNIIGFEGKALKILVVDNHKEDRLIVASLLQPLGFEINQADNGLEGLKKAQQWQPDIIITDIAMPEMDGYAMINQLRCSPQFINLPIIVSSVNVFPRDQQKSIDVGANDFIPKPIQTDNLLQVLRQNLKLNWIYAQKNEQKELLDQATSTKKNLAFVLPNIEELNLLQDLIRKGLINNLIKELDRLDNLDCKFILFTDRLRQLARQYQLKQLKAEIENFLQVN